MLEGLSHLLHQLQSIDSSGGPLSFDPSVNAPTWMNIESSFGGNVESRFGWLIYLHHVYTYTREHQLF